MTQQKRLAPRLVLNDLSGFDAHEYSQFKYGDTRPAVEYAEEIYRHCLQGQIQSTEVDVVFSPNTYLPTAAHSIAEELISILSSAGHDCQDVNVHRQTTYTKDYGKMNAQERANMISGDTYGFKNQPRKDATMVFVDDVSITGTHQHILEQLMEKSGLLNPQKHVYYGVKADHQIPASIESMLNRAAISSPEEIIPLMMEPRFKLNTRATKSLLSCSHLKEYIKSIPGHLLDSMVDGAAQNGYHNILEYRQNFLLAQEFSSQST